MMYHFWSFHPFFIRVILTYCKLEPFVYTQCSNVSAHLVQLNLIGLFQRQIQDESPEIHNPPIIFQSSFFFIILEITARWKLILPPF